MDVKLGIQREQKAPKRPRDHVRTGIPANNRYRASTDMPWGGPVKVTQANGDVHYEPALTFRKRRDLTRHSSRKVLSRSMKNEILMRDGYTCQNCSTTTGPFHIDHIRPYSKGGWQDPSNLQTLCVPCNTSKGVTWERS